jgi:hypothetical protein
MQKLRKSKRKRSPSKGRLRRQSKRTARNSLGQPYHKTKREKGVFSNLLQVQMERHGDNAHTLYQAVCKPGEKFNDDTIRNWLAARNAPRWATSKELLRRIERRYGLPLGYFNSKLNPDSATQRAVKNVTLAQQHVVRWHLPDDFDNRSRAKQEEIIDWIQRNVLAGATDYGRFLRVATQKRYSIRFPVVCDERSRKPQSRRYARNAGGDDNDPNDDIGRSMLVNAPPGLASEIAELVKFKTSTMAPAGFKRHASWSDYTAAYRVRHFGLIFGAFIASPRSSVEGLGIHPSKLTIAMLICPSFWDWMLLWRERRRGFLTIFERHLVLEMMALTRKETGWIRQNPKLAKRLKPIRGFISNREILAYRKNWDRACDTAYSYFRERSRELYRVMRVHRDAFEAVRVVLNKKSPLTEYRKIAHEVLRHLPNEKLDPVAAAEAVRAYLMLRFGMHLGLRQRNLRELLLCPRGSQPKHNVELERRKCGELRWSKDDRGWEVYIPAIAFKNSHSTFFRKGPFRIILPNLENLYRWIDLYLKKHRTVLLRGHTDPGTFFVRTMKSDRISGAFDSMAFYSAWRLTILRYGIYNPYTGIGAIEGLLPHGPHNVRDVLATHVLKQTGSYEMASFAIHDTPEVARRHYCRFLPEEKAAMAASVLNKAWSN